MRQQGPEVTPHATRQRLVQAALDLFTTAGFRGTTTPMLAERAGVAEGTIYRHFKSKAELLNEVHREVQQWGAALVRDETARDGRAPDTLRRIARRLVEAAAQSPATVRMLLQERDADQGRGLDERSREAAREFRAALQQVIAAGKSDGLVRPGAAELWASVWLAVIAFVAERVCAREWTPDHPHVMSAFDAAWAGIAAPSTALAGETDNESRGPSSEAPPPVSPGKTSARAAAPADWPI